MLYLPFLILFWAAYAVQAATSDRMTEFRMAYLIKNNVETSCMVAVMSMKAVFVAANCIDMKSGYAVDQSVNYKLRYTPTDNDEEPTFDVAATHITIHPKYNQVTLENNIAIIEFNEDTDDDYVSFVSTNDFYAKIETYVRRNYDESKSEWDTPNVFNQYSEGDDCKNSSSLYETNSEWMSCTSSVTTSHVNSDCSIPYGIMYIDNTNATVMTSLYSHSVVYGNDMCSKPSKIINYYTLLWPYLGFAANTLGHSVKVYTPVGWTEHNSTEINNMYSPDDTSVSGTTTVGGDLYPNQRDFASSAASSDNSTADETTSSVDKSSSAEDSSNDSSASDAEKEDSSSNDSDNKSKSNKKLIIGLSAGLGSLVVLLSVVLVALYLRKKRREVTWDPNGQSLNLSDIVVEMRSDQTHVIPPPYEPASNDTTVSGSAVHVDDNNLKKE